MNDYCRRINLIKEKDQQLSGDDFREGMVAVLSIKMQNIQFEGQTKTRLGNTEARSAVDSIILEGLTNYFEDLKMLKSQIKLPTRQ